MTDIEKPLEDEVLEPGQLPEDEPRMVGGIVEAEADEDGAAVANPPRTALTVVRRQARAR